MNYEYCIDLEWEELYYQLIEFTMSDAEGGLALAEQLSKTDRYRLDYAYRAAVETVRALVWSANGESKRVIGLCDRLIETTTALGLWKLVAMNQNLLGTAYFNVGMYERALESYHAVIRTEEQRELCSSLPLGYNNIALIFMKLESFDKAQEYMSLALEALDRQEETSRRQLSKKILFTSKMISILSFLGRLEEIPPLLEKIADLGLENADLNTLYNYHMAKMYHGFYSNNVDAAREEFLQVKALLEDPSDRRRVTLLSDYVALCQEMNFPSEYYSEEMDYIEKLEPGENVLTHLELYEALRKFYEKNGEEESYERITEKYIELLEKYQLSVFKERLDSLTVVEELLQNTEDASALNAKNLELQMITDEAIRHKNEFQRSYRQLEIINELGRKLTSSVKLSEVLDLIYKNLQENVPLTTFLLMVADKENGKLRCMVNYSIEPFEEDLSVNIDDPNSFLVECYQRGEMLVFDERTKSRWEGRNYIRRGPGEILSAIYMPLIVDGTVIGVCSIQDLRPCVYEEEHIRFLEQLLPYLSISLNNAVRSDIMEQEIRFRMEAQEELEDANVKLERLSSLDSLTQINNRRTFENRVLDLIRKTRERAESFAIFMLDIDNFKKYNDTYGHFSGDEMLKIVAREVSENLDRVGGLSARFGGEEFIAACGGLSQEEVMAVGEAIRKSVWEKNIEHEKSELGRLTVSVGISYSDTADVSQKSLLMRWADACLYEAKKTGKNRVVLRSVEPGEDPPEGLI